MEQKFIPLSVPNLKGNELKYVTKAIESEWVSTAGEYVNNFETEIAKYVKSKGAVSCQNGTAGIHVSLEILGVTKDDEVIVPTLTFIAAVNPVKYIGAEPIFMDCDDTLCMDMDKLREFCEIECTFENNKLINNKTNKHIKAVVVVHVFGNMANMEALMEIANKYSLKVIEDATEALGTYYTGGMYEGKFAGTIGHMGIYSFNGNKIITTGGGGMIVSEDEALLQRAKFLTTQAKTDELYFVHDEIGYNYRMTNLQAALGLAQLEQLPNFIEIKKNNFNRYFEAFENIDNLSLLKFSSNISPNYWFYALFVDKNYKMDRDDMIKYLSTKKVQVRPIWGLISDQKPYLNSQKYKIEKARYYIDHIVNIPCSSNLLKEDVDYVVDCLK